jgi:hypothetical protein
MFEQNMHTGAGARRFGFRRTDKLPAPTLNTIISIQYGRSTIPCNPWKDPSSPGTVLVTPRHARNCSFRDGTEGARGIEAQDPLRRHTSLAGSTRFARYSLLCCQHQIGTVSTHRQRTSLFHKTLKLRYFDIALPSFTKLATTSEDNGVARAKQPRRHSEQ